ncbi:MAG TPA: GNAT family N-acetyltransferase [Mycobacteriales bacterium]|nr:GNAT family N-acetyltransferase [Mycobacteriales bacterium]
MTPAFTTRELSTRTWPDFVDFFSNVHGCACTLYSFGRHLPLTGKTAAERAKLYGPPDRSKKHFPAQEQRRAQELAAVRELLDQGRFHGILVYSGDEPVGWCQFGPVGDLPVDPNDKIEPRMLARDPASQWRITCFTTRLDHRRQGVASIALKAAVAAIRKRGGGWVEATPLAFAHHDPVLPKLRSTYRWRSEEVREHLKDWPEKDIPGVGHFRAGLARRSLDHSGLMSMFERAGFEAVRRDDLGSSDQWWTPHDRVLMRMKV